MTSGTDLKMSPSDIESSASLPMSVALLFITHERIATGLLAISEAIIQKPNHNVACVEVPMDTPVATATTKIEQQLAQLDTADGLVFFTDVYGSTPGNIAQQLATKYHANLISGINLPMIIRLLNYRDENMEELLQKALDGAHQGIQLYNKTEIYEH